MNMSDKIHDIIVIGAGVIGISSALALQADGHDVLVVDRQDGKLRASQMNAGAFAFTEIEPLATPGIMRKAPKWLLDPLGPLSIPPAYALGIAPWMLRFWRASWPDRHDQALAAQAGLMSVSKAAFEKLVRTTQAEALVRKEGQLQLFEGEKEYRASQPVWELRRQHGIRFDLLESPEAIADIQPGLSRRFTHAGFTPDWSNTTDPARWLAHLCERFLERGGRQEAAEITGIAPREGEIRLTTRQGKLSARQVVVSAGAWSHHLAKTIGDRIPLETERGYNTTLAHSAFDLRTHLTFSGHGFVASRINDGIRVGGAVELGGLKLPPNFKRADILLKKARMFMPELKTDGGTQWMGFRPSMPDSLPVISRSPKDARVLYAFGHGHLGLTQSAGTAELVAALVGGRPAPIDIDAFSAVRF